MSLSARGQHGVFRYELYHAVSEASSAAMRFPDGRPGRPAFLFPSCKERRRRADVRPPLFEAGTGFVLRRDSKA